MIKRLINWWKVTNSWKFVRFTGVWVYDENTFTGQRRAVRVGSCYQPLDFLFIRNGDRIIDNGTETVVGYDQ